MLEVGFLIVWNSALLVGLDSAFLIGLYSAFIDKTAFCDSTLIILLDLLLTVYSLLIDKCIFFIAKLFVALLVRDGLFIKLSVNKNR